MLVLVLVLVLCYGVCVLLLLLLGESPRERAVGLGQYSARVFCHGQTGRVAAAGFLDAASRERGGGNINSLWPSSLHRSKAVPYPSRPELKHPSDRHVRVARPSLPQAVDRQQKKKNPLPCAWEGNWHPQCPWPLPESSMPLPPFEPCVRRCVGCWRAGARADSTVLPSRARWEDLHRLGWCEGPRCSSVSAIEAGAVLFRFWPAGSGKHT